MNAFKCDRCGKLYEKQPHLVEGLVVAERYSSGCYERKDICPECYDKFLLWWKSKNEGGHNDK